MEAALTDGTLGKRAGRLEDPHPHLFLKPKDGSLLGRGGFAS